MLYFLVLIHAGYGFLLVEAHQSQPYLISNETCLEQCGKAGHCESVCGMTGFCCRKDFGECLQSFEDEAPVDHHACVKGTLELKHEVAKHFENCELTVLPGTHMIRDNIVFGTLDVLPDEFSISLDFKPLINSSNALRYLLVLHSRESRGKGGEFIVHGKNGIFKAVFCGSLSGNLNHHCLSIKNDIKVNDKVHLHVHQTKDVNDIYHQEIYINHMFVRSGVNTEAMTLKNVSVVGVVVPKTKNAGYMGNIKLGVCNGKFNKAQKET